jgi:hypothetical protein
MHITDKIPTRDDIERIALSDPIVNHYYIRHINGDITYIESLQLMVIALSKIKQELNDELFNIHLLSTDAHIIGG